MWDYSQIPKKRADLAALTPEKRDSLTWEEASRFLRADTMTFAVWGGMRGRQEGRPFDAVCIANGFHDLLTEPATT